MATSDKDDLAKALAKLRVYFHNIGEAAGFAQGAFDTLDNSGIFAELDDHTGYATPEDVLNIGRKSGDHVTVVPPELYDEMMSDTYVDGSLLPSPVAGKIIRIEPRG